MAANSNGGQRNDMLKILTPAVVLVLIAFTAAYLWMNPAPPSQIRIASGQPDGAYYLFAQRYRELLRKQKIDLVVETSAGSLENIQRLGAAPVSPEAVDLALVQGGTADEQNRELALAIASVYFEPIWVFQRSDRARDKLADLDGGALAVGPPGSGTRRVALELLAENGIDDRSARLLPLGGESAGEALLKGELDAVFMIASAESPSVQRLLRSPGVSLMNFERAEAYTRRHRYLSSVSLPRGVIDLDLDLPPADVEMLAVSANLVVRPDLHPALIDLLLQTADQVHAGGGLFEEPGEFPSPRYLDFPLHKEAKRYYKSGPPFLQRYLPFWAASLLDRLKVMLLPLVALVLPLIKLFPPTYRWRMRSRIYRWYERLQAVERQLDQIAGEAERAELLAELDHIELDLRQVSVPLSYSDELYNLRLHLSLIRDQVRQAALVRAEG